MMSSPIQQFYSNSKILITGATGFFGRILLEKLLRSCPDVSMIYVLIRKKNGKDSTTRVQEILNDVLFHRLMEERSDCRSKVFGIEGDCSLPNLGLSYKDVETLKKEVNIIFHLAATVSFVEKLKTATFINTRATRDILSLARQMAKLKAMIHVSTVYSNCIRPVIEEKFYPPAIDGNTLIGMAENLSDDILEELTDKLLGEYPNTYTFTKQIAEGIMKEIGSDLPTGILRPAIVVSTYKEPIKSWINNLYSATGLIAFTGLGFLRTIYGDQSLNSNVVPVDMCVNSLIVAAWDVGMNFEASKEQNKQHTPLIYHYESNSENPITWSCFTEKSLNYGSETSNARNAYIITKNKYIYNICNIFMHILPGLVSDIISLCSGKSATVILLILSSMNSVQQFYSNSKILITGATGFFGKTLLEKLLRSCPDVSIIYVLIRQKNGKDSTTRVEEIFNDVLFHRLMKERPDCRSKVFGIEGDCSLPNLGLSDQAVETLKKEVNIIFHLAATVSFIEKLKVATFINTRATRDILRLARQMPNLKAMMHVSTAYSNCIRPVIEEKFYPPAISGNTLIGMAEDLSDDILEEFSDKLLGEYPNTYTFTKQIAEGLVKEIGYDLPIGVLRPAIVVSTYKEPIKSWINNFYSVTGLIAFTGLGILRTMYGDESLNSNVVPVDMCVNSLLAAAWNVGMTFETFKKQNKQYIPLIYHYESNSENPIKWGSFIDTSLNYGSETSNASNAYLITKNNYVYNIRKIFMHILPGLVSDIISLCSGKSARALKTYFKLHTFDNILSHFSIREWTYKSNNIRKMIDKMSNKDKEIFFADLKELNWDEFLKTHFEGIKLYALKHPKDDISEAERRQKL